jgi:mono/diheme cytochrome c family protein
MRASAAALVLTALVPAACGRAPRPAPTDAVQQAFRDGTLSRLESRGHRLFAERCATCHGATGRGEGQNAFNLDPPPPDFSQSLSKIGAAERRRIIEGGTAAVGRSALCPPRGRALGDTDTEALLAYLDVLARPAEPTPRPGRRLTGFPSPGPARTTAVDLESR